MSSTIYSNTAQMRHDIRVATGVKGFFAHDPEDIRGSVYKNVNAAGANVKLTDNQLDEINQHVVSEAIRVTENKSDSEFYNLMKCIAELTEPRDQMSFQTISARVGNLATAIKSYSDFG